LILLSFYPKRHKGFGFLSKIVIGSVALEIYFDYIARMFWKRFFIFLAMTPMFFVATSAFSQSEDELILDELLQEEDFPMPPPMSEQQEQDGEETTLPGPKEPSVEGEPAGGDEEEVISYKLDCDIAATLSYSFTGSQDRFTVKYHMNLTGNLMNKDLSVLKGEASIITNVDGYLAKWPTGQCALGVSISKVPFDLVMKKPSDNEGTINIQLKGNILEDWKSTCSFTDAPGAEFVTTGTPEKWLEQIIKNIDPPLNQIPINLSNTNSSVTFSSAKSTISDPPLGEARVDAIGTLTLEVKTNPKPPQGQNK
jgi:hypothetical protein